MSACTLIQWCDSTVNPVMGCDGCELRNDNVTTCYAGQLHDQRGGKIAGYAPSFSQVTAFPGRTALATRWSDLTGQTRPERPGRTRSGTPKVLPGKPWLDGSPRLIFVSDMGDSLSRTVSFEYLRDEVIAAATTERGGRHRWLWLTKRPVRMAAFSAWLCRAGTPWPGNVWVGTTVTTQVTTARVGHLLRVGDDLTVRFVSVEPQLERADLRPWLGRVDWVIQGGESGRGARSFDVAWAHDMRAQCMSAGVPYFLKQLGARPHDGSVSLGLRDRHGGDWNEWPESLRHRAVPTVHDAHAQWRHDIFTKAMLAFPLGGTK